MIIVFLAFTGNDIEAKKSPKKTPIKMTQWEEVNEILPRYSKFTVVDFEMSGTEEGGKQSCGCPAVNFKRY